ncbi:MAG: CbiX/SirB N-terminal domain-containing protein [Sneathiella sp.]
MIIVAHGSRVSDNAQDAAIQHAATLQQSNRYGRVDIYFLARDEAIPILPDGEIFLLPFFMSNGYFVSNRIPELFELQGGRRIESDRQLYLCDALGTDPELAGIIAAMAHDVCHDHDYAPEKIRLVLVAHGSEKSPAPAETTFLQQRAVEGRGEFAEVSVAFLNEPPFLEEVLAAHHEDDAPLVLVGLFAADGPHASEDVPGAIANWRKQFARNGEIHYAGAIGPRPEIVRLIQLSISRCAARAR